MTRILVADDEEPVRDVFKDLLEADGYIVETAPDGQTALQKIWDGGYDIILLDIIMPNMDGITVLRKLKQHPSKLPNGLIIMLSVLEETDFVKTCLSLGANGFIHKHAGTPEDLVNQVKALLNKENPKSK